MINFPEPRSFNRAVSDVLASINTDPKIKTATKFVSPKFTVKATRRFKFTRRATRDEVVLTFGAPNYKEREFIKTATKVKEPFPVKKVQLRFRPEKRT